MNLVVTAGPAWEPLDGMRRLTNASTGRLGSLLADALAGAGHRVILYRAEGSTAAGPAGPVEVRRFGTNDDLARELETLARGGETSVPVDAILHAAALCDFKVAGARTSDGTVLRAAKLPSREGRLTVELEPATKVLPRLRDWFPRARIVGWKYELNGGPADALAAAIRQLGEARSDACVLNGAAWGEGFAIVREREAVIPCRDEAALAASLLGLLTPVSGFAGDPPPTATATGAG